jgi:hypothetical protein
MVDPRDRPNRCGTCGALTRTGEWSLWPSTRTFCSEACRDKFYGPPSNAPWIVRLICYPIAFLSPFFAFLYVGFKLVPPDHPGIGWLAGIGAAIVTGAFVSQPIYTWLGRWKGPDGRAPSSKK